MSSVDRIAGSLLVAVGEAARAGDTGAGLAVVADEVRKMAQTGSCRERDTVWRQRVFADQWLGVWHGDCKSLRERMPP